MTQRHRPVPSPETITPTTPLRLAIAARIAFPDGSIGESGLRNEIARGNLVAEKIAGKLFVTLAAVDDMRSKCRVLPKASNSTADLPNAKAESGAGSSSTPTPSRAKSAQAHLEMTAQRLRKSSPSTSPKSTNPASAKVVPLKS
jgi:hypothetical protein